MATLQSNQIVVENDELIFPINLRDDEPQWVVADSCSTSVSISQSASNTFTDNRNHAREFYSSVLVNPATVESF